MLLSKLQKQQTQFVSNTQTLKQQNNKTTKQQNKTRIKRDNVSCKDKQKQKDVICDMCYDQTLAKNLEYFFLLSSLSLFIPFESTDGSFDSIFNCPANVSNDNTCAFIDS